MTKVKILHSNSMKEAMKKALEQSKQAPSSTVQKLFDLLGEAQEALREAGYNDAVLELRQGLQTDYGLRYTAYLRNESASFENPLFSIFIDEVHCAFQAEGPLQSDLSPDEALAAAREYLLQPHVVTLMSGLLHQFGRSAPSLAPDLPSTV
jgi:hypothetical protein